MFITRGAIDAVEDESELAAVLAHEVVHVAERHGARSIEAAYKRRVILSGLAEAAAERSGADPRLVKAFGALTDELTENLLTRGMGRKMELEADAKAAQASPRRCLHCAISQATVVFPLVPVTPITCIAADGESK